MTLILPTQLDHGDLAIATFGLSKRFRRGAALDGINLQVPEGAVFVLVGPNGAGKSTTFRILMDLVRATEGRSEVFRTDTRVGGPVVRAQIGYVPERLDWGYAWMRVGRLLEHHALHYPAWDRSYAERLIRVFNLGLDRNVGSLSKGETRRVHLTMALI